ncbi:DNA helicase [Paucilactobacillus hokkaidonensis JCM 18461]|uniref:DNA helicase n=2 Tax=Paucilactobacillus hokkaidonensis TaxID=1193095 RepID=A0A0A1GWW5_9LACO|nr:RNA polymerase recycling motor HelD [Paucilactobacillus hokkaidonensis]KRO09674.1 superfamily I DNA RNA helicase-like protein [Paucilactobacillus hokkaidonensis]BAP84931.1 DNA helicase [Paucilactobacillus hokkaidonensis JCM 18461]
MTEKSERQIEQNRVDDVTKQVSAQIKASEDLFEQAHHETRMVDQNYSDNASVNLYEVDDAMETNAMIEQQRQLVARSFESETILKRQLDTLSNLKSSPYFGRIDIKDSDEPEAESLYIGVASLMNDDKSDFLIYDWRAPVAGIYYNGNLGAVKYSTPAGPQSTELVKKRQFTIKNGHITTMFDTNETVGDEMLQAALGEQNDQYMQNIVATIQKEQNDIIRDTDSDLLLVQGVAGSGKTSAILQRIAYLLYHSRASLNADQIVLFSPNRLFSNYISEVLPSLGERNMRQVTLAEFLSRRFEGLDVQTLFERYENEQTNGIINQAAQNYLESAACMQSVRNYCRSLTPQQMKFSNILFEGRIFFTADHIRDIFAKLPQNMAIADKTIATKNSLIKELKRRIKDEAKSDWVSEEVSQLNNEDLHDLLGKKKSDEFETEDELLDYVSNRLATKRLRIVYDAIYNNYFFDPYAQYSDFLNQSQPDNVADNVAAESWQQIIANFKQEIEYHQISLMYCTSLLYLRDLVTGSGQNRQLEYVFIDEMQDYSIAALIYLKHVFPKAKFTILGDSEQALFKEIEPPHQLLDRLSTALKAKKPNLIVLNRSYRSTTEITNFAKSLLPDGDQILPFNRHGDLPRIILRYSQADATNALLDEVKAQAEAFETVAILTKNAVQAHAVYQQLRQFGNVNLLKDTDRVLPSGILIMPIYLAKGLEFDAVIAYDVSETNYSDPRATGILYTIASRAMHQLTLLSIGAACPIIAADQEKLLQIEHSI